MTSYPQWTPASRPGIIPLHPLTFGTILGRSFAALRHNPKVLLGFGLVVQTVAYLLVLLGVGGVAVLTFSRLDNVPASSDAFEAIFIGSTAITAIVGFVLGLAAAALGVIVQAVVVSEVAHGALAEKLSLGMLWRRVKPVIWRVIGYSFLLTLAVSVLIAVVVGVLVLIGFAALPIAIALGVLVVLGAIPLALWLSVKLLLVPSAIILENAGIRAALARSWRLTRGRFWPALGVIVLISFTFGAIAQVVSLPFSFLGTGLSTLFAPTGDPGVSTIVTIIVTSIAAQILTLIVQAVAVVVQSTSAAIIYIDCRMRHEALDLDLLAYVDKRDAGEQDLPDPYRIGIGREAPPRPAWIAPQPYAPPAYAPPAYAPVADARPPYAAPATPAQAGPPPQGAPAAHPSQQPYGQPAPGVAPPPPYVPPAAPAPADAAGDAPNPGAPGQDPAADDDDGAASGPRPS
ncbi:MAG: hypothetical protein CMH33_02910 [Microbacterium sp.]|nr:hypothetical protein [Microbacterium sp.]